MIKLTINNEPVALKPNYAVKLTRLNSLFGGNGDYSLPIELSMEDPQNCKALGYIHDPQVTGDRRQFYDAHFSKFGIPLMVGQMQLSKTGDLISELSLKSNNADFWPRVKNMVLQDLNWPEIAAFESSIPDPLTVTEIVDELMTTLDGSKPYVSFEFENEFEVDPNFPDWKKFNHWDFENQRFYEDVDGNGIQKYSYTIFLRLHVVLRKIFELQGFQILTNYFEGSNALKDIVIITPKDILNNPTKTSDGNYLSRKSWGAYLPDGTVYDFLKTLEKSGIHFVIDSLNSTVSITTKNASFDQVPVELSGIINKSLEITPDTRDGYLVTFAKSGGYASKDISEYISNNLTQMQQLIDYGYTLFTDLPSASLGKPGTVAYVKQEGVFYEIVDDSGLKWEVRTGLCQPISSGNKEEKVPIAISTAYSKRFQYEKVFSFHQETVRYEFTKPMLNITPEGFKDVLLSVFRGMGDCLVTSGDMPTYNRHFPYAHYLNVHPDGTEIVGGLRLDNTFYFNLQNRYLQFMTESNKAELKLEAHFTFLIKDTFKHRLVNGQLFIPEGVSAPLKDNNTQEVFTITGRIEQTE